MRWNGALRTSTARSCLYLMGVIYTGKTSTLVWWLPLSA